MSESHIMTDTLGLKDEKTGGSEQYLTFSLDDKEYGVDILRVQEIKAWDKVTHIPNSPLYLCGVFNWRGDIVPIVDLRLRFGMSTRAYTPTTVVVVLKINELVPRTVAIVVDSVSDAHDVFPEDIKPVPNLGRLVNTDFISGLVSIDDTMMMILNIESLLSVEALG